jgi:hypothetical protein
VTVSDLLLDLLRRAEADLPGVEILTADEVSPWPVGVVEALVQDGFLSPTTPGTSVLCDACLEDHWQEVEFVESPPGTRRAYIVCPEAGRVAVDTTRLNRWRVNLAGLAGVLGQLLGCREAPDELVASRLWRLGRTELAGGSRDAFLVRGLTWPNAAETLRLEQRLSRDASSLLLTLVDTVVDPAAGACVVPLTRVLSLAHNGLSLDLSYIESVLVSDADRSLGGRNTFRKQGEYWPIVYEGRQSNLRDLKGLRYIACLLASPGREFHVLELVALVAGTRYESEASTDARMTTDQLAEDGLTVSQGDHSEPLLDAQARTEYQTRIRELEEDIDEAESNNNSELAAKLKEERDSIVDQLLAASGLGGRERRTSSSAERARINVTKQIGSALDKIEKEHGLLGRHLRNAIRTGAFCIYSPETPTDWVL